MTNKPKKINKLVMAELHAFTEKMNQLGAPFVFFAKVGQIGAEVGGFEQIISGRSVDAFQCTSKTMHCAVALSLNDLGDTMAEYMFPMIDEVFKSDKAKNTPIDPGLPPKRPIEIKEVI